MIPRRLGDRTTAGPGVRLLAALVLCGAIPAAVAGEAGRSTPVRITGISEGSPAARAGLRAGDEIIRVNGSLVRDADHLRLLLLDSKADERLSVEVQREGSHLTAGVEVDEFWTAQSERRLASRLPPNRLPTIEQIGNRRRFELPYAASVHGRSGDFDPGAVTVSASSIEPVEIPTRGGFPAEQRLLCGDGFVIHAPPTLSSIRADAARLRGTAGQTHADLFVGVSQLNSAATSRWRGWGMMGWDRDEGAATGASLPLSRVRYWGFACGSLGASGRIAVADRLATVASQNGFCVINVQQGAAAHLAGILTGDLILKADGTAIRDPADLFDLMTASRPGQEVQLHLLRGGVELDVVLRVGGASIPARPQVDDQGPHGLPFLLSKERGEQRATSPSVRRLRFAFHPPAPEPLLAEADAVRTEVVAEVDGKPVQIRYTLRGNVAIQYAGSIRVDCASARLTWTTPSRAPGVLMYIGDPEAEEAAMNKAAADPRRLGAVWIAYLSRRPKA